MAKISPLYHDWLRALNSVKCLLFGLHRREGECEGHFLNYTILRGISFSSLVSLLFELIDVYSTRSRRFRPCRLGQLWFLSIFLAWRQP